MDHTTSEQAAACRAANKELSSDLMRLEEILEYTIQNLNSPGKMHLLSPIH